MNTGKLQEPAYDVLLSIFYSFFLSETKQKCSHNPIYGEKRNKVVS